jgi:hypothetical protein
MEIALFDKNTISSMEWPIDGSLSYEKNCLTPFVVEGAKRFIQNVETDFRLLKVGKHVFPVTINETEYSSSYVCSPYTHNVSYAKEELYNLGCKPIESLCRFILNILGIILKLGKINQTVHINNWLLSTNLYPDWEGEGINEITQFFLKNWPNHAIVFRSINQCHEQAAFDKFKEAGYQFFLTRQVYIFEGKNPTYLKTKNFKWDWKLLQKGPYKWVHHNEIEESDIPRILSLYNALYLDKYSYHNPQFTEEYLRLCLKEGLLTLHGLRHPDGHLDGIIGYFARNGIMTTPLVGYNRSLPQETGLYRMLMAITLKCAAEEAVTLNLSAGAASFKRHRGGIGYLEYSTLYLDHLPLYRKLPWQVLMTLMNTVGTYIMRKYQL